MLAGAGLSRAWPHDRAHWFFSSARWSADELGLAVARLVAGLLVPAGEPVTVAIDDTLFRRRGKKVWAASWFHDGSAPGPAKTGYGNNWVIAAIIVKLPAVGRPVAVPVLAKLVIKNTNSASRLWLALLAARSPKLRRALRDARKAGHAYLVIDGTLVPIDRVAAERPFYSGNHRRHGMNLQVIASPDGDIVWVSGPLPGAVHDLTAARIWGIVQALAALGLVVLGDKGYLGEDHIRLPYRGRNKPASQKEANRAHSRLRAPGERANAQLKTWRILRKLRCCPWKARQLAKAIHVLQARELPSIT